MIGVFVCIFLMAGVFLGLFIWAGVLGGVLIWVVEWHWGHSFGLINRFIFVLIFLMAGIFSMTFHLAGVLSGFLIRVVEWHLGHYFGLINMCIFLFSALVVESSSCWLESPCSLELKACLGSSWWLEVIIGTGVLGGVWLRVVFNFRCGFHEGYSLLLLDGMRLLFSALVVESSSCWL